MRTKSSRRSSRVVAAKAGKAARSAATARSTSAAAPIAMRPAGASVAGLITSRKAGTAGSTHWPSI